MSFSAPRLSGGEASLGETPLQDLEAVIRSRVPIISIETNEEPEVVRLVRRISQHLQLKAYRWTVSDGLQSFDPADQPRDSVRRSNEVLAHIRTNATHSLFVLLDFHPFLADSLHVRQLKDIALNHSSHYCTVLIVGHTLQMPPELRPYSSPFKLPLPTSEDLRQIVLDEAAKWGAQNGRRDVQTTNKALDLLIRNLAGLTASAARQLARKAVEDDGVISEADLPALARGKYELLGRDGMLAFEPDTVRFVDVGGMARLRKWLEVRKSFFHGESVLLDPPRGILLLGVQGCGKSLAAKATAGILGVPLLRLDFGVLYNKFYGETERNLRGALEMAEGMSPCVLWMDEIEKGIATDSDDDGLSRRVLGTLLTWMSEKRKAVFLVATANDITRLPPELVRKGRFDEIFFVDLPSAGNRADIFRIHLQKRKLEASGFDINALVEASQGYSGSEIEQAIISAMYAAHAEGRSPGQADLLNELQQTRPLSVVMSESVASLRDWASSRTVPCD